MSRSALPRRGRGGARRPLVDETARQILSVPLAGGEAAVAWELLVDAALERTSDHPPSRAMPMSRSPTARPAGARRPGGWRALGVFWVAVLALAGGGVAVLEHLGPPTAPIAPMPTPSPARHPAAPPPAISPQHIAATHPAPPGAPSGSPAPAAKPAAPTAGAAHPPSPTAPTATQPRLVHRAPPPPRPCRPPPPEAQRAPSVPHPGRRRNSRPRR